MYPKKLYFLITNVNKKALEFEFNAQIGDIIEGEYLCTDFYEEDDKFVEYANYEVKEIPYYALMVIAKSIDSNDDEYSHHSFSYQVYSSKEKAMRYYIL